jgi:hypothetical protein
VNREQAQAILTAEVRRLRQEQYEQLVSRLLDKQESSERAAPDGTKYQLEVQALWDDRALRNLRVIVSVERAKKDVRAGASAPRTS